MRIVIDTNVISPHMVPLSEELAKIIGDENLSYFYFGKCRDPHRMVGMTPWILTVAKDISGLDGGTVTDLKMSADILLENVRDFGIMQKRVANGEIAIYQSERWFKPVRIDAPRNSERAKGVGLSVPGFIRMLFPFALKRSIQMMRLFRKQEGFLYFPIGIWAARDMARMCGLMNGDLRCLFRAPRLSFEPRPGGRIHADNGQDKRYCLDKMRLWGYFVAEASGENEERSHRADDSIHVLWVGRMFGWKRVDTIIRAVAGLPNVELDLFGAGPEEMRLKRMAKGLHNVHFRGMVPLAEVRQQMREHDVYVLSSNEFEGWGAVINEALEEGMQVFGTYEAGASATILPESNLFRCGDWRALRRLLQIRGRRVGIGSWSVKCAAQEVIKIAKEVGGC